MRELLRHFDWRVARWMAGWGHLLHRLSFGAVFVWFGALKVAGIPTATHLLAHTIYVGTPRVMVPFLGAWEVAIGVCMLSRRLIRLGLLLLAVRLPGTLLALVAHPDVCFVHFPWAPSPEGQYLIKDAMLFFAALVIGGTVHHRRVRGVHH